MSTAEAPVYEWRDTPWREIERQVYKLQRRIFRASQRGDAKMVHRLQRLLMSSWAARALAVRKATQDNRGQNTAGIDGVAKLTPRERQALVADLRVNEKARPVRRVWIPKPGKAEKRPLGIPTIRDRARQTLVRLAMEPDWEARFEANSYGFRPGRSAHDAIQAIFNAIRVKPKFVLDADIAACFDRIDHGALLRKLQTFPTLRRVIKAWLKAGVWDGVDLTATSEGTPQGGALSPLLANIALHGLESHLRSRYPDVARLNGRRHREWKPFVVRFADDFVILHEDLRVILQVREQVSEWLSRIGLELKAEKTRIAHTLDAHEGLQVGLDFLAFNVRQFHHSPNRCGKNTHSERQAFKTLITPSREARKRHLDETRLLTRKLRAAPVEKLIAALNPVVGWAQYYSAVASKQVFDSMDWHLTDQLYSWARRRHPRKNYHWVKARYWHTRGKRSWVFGPRTGRVLMRHADTPIIRHVKVQGTASPYDGNLLYWATRLGRHPELPPGKASLLKRQRGRCARCHNVFTDADDLMENDHVTPRSKGGKDDVRNRQLLHRHCHGQKTARDGSLCQARGEVSQTTTIHRGAV
jgi:RNA-directed DNA polymerase